MKFSPPRCSPHDPTCRLSELTSSGPRPVWSALDAAAAQRFSGEITLGCEPPARVWFSDGAVYYAEHDGCSPLPDRLMELGVLTPMDIAGGEIRIGSASDLSRLFRRVPTLDRDRVEVGLELLAASTIGEVAERTALTVSVRNHRHHPSGVHTWLAARRQWDDELVDALRSALTSDLAAELDAASDSVAVPEPTVEIATAVAETEPVGVPTPGPFPSEPFLSDPAPAVPEPVDEWEPEAFVSEPAPVVPEPEWFMKDLGATEPSEVFEPEQVEVDAFEAVEIEAEAEEVEAEEVEAPTVITLTPTLPTLPTLSASPSPPAMNTEPLDLRLPAPATTELSLPAVIERVVQQDRLADVDSGDEPPVSDDIREAVRAALAEIQAATRPLVTDGLTADAARPVERPRVAEPEPEPAAVHHGSLRRLIGGRGH